MSGYVSCGILNAYMCYCLRVSEAELALAREDIGLLPSNLPPDMRTRAPFTAIKVSYIIIYIWIIASYNMRIL